MVYFNTNSSFNYVELHAFCLAIILTVLIFILIKFDKIRGKSTMAMIGICITESIVLITDALWAINEGLLMNASIFSYVMNAIYFTFVAFNFYHWYLLVEYAISSSVSKNKIYKLVVAIPAILVAIMAFSSHKTGWVFTLKNGVYERGNQFAIVSILMYGYLLVSGLRCLVHIIRSKSYLDRIISFTTLIYVFPITISAILQLVFDMAFNCIGHTMAIVYIFLMIILSSASRRDKEFVRKFKSIAGLTEDFDLIYYVDFEHDTYERLSKTVDTSNISEEKRMKPNFYEMLIKKLNQSVYNEDLPLTKSLLTIDKIIDEIAKHGVYFVNYRAMRNDDLVYRQIKILNADQPNTFILGFHDVDDSFKLEMIHRQEVERLNHKYSAYVKAIYANAIGYYEVNITKNKLITPIYEFKDGTPINVNEQIGIGSNDSFTDFLENRKRIVIGDEKDYEAKFNSEYFSNCYNNGDLFLEDHYWVVDPWGNNRYQKRETYLTKSFDSGDILALVVLYDETKLAEADKEIIWQKVITKSLAKDYENIYIVDLRSNKFDLIQKSDNYVGIIGGISRGKDYFKEVSNNATKYVYKDDANSVLEKLTKENIVSQLETQQTYFIDYRMNDVNGGLHFYQLKIAYVDEKKISIVIGTNNVDQLKLAEKEASVNESLINGISDDFEYISFIDYESGMVYDIRQSKMFQQVIPNWESIKVGVEKSAAFNDNIILPDDLTTYKSDIKVDKILDYLEKNDTYFVNYRINVNGEIHYCQSKYVKVSDQVNAVILGIRIVDDLIKAKELELRRQSIIDMFVSDYTTILFLDLSDDKVDVYRAPNELEQWMNNSAKLGAKRFFELVKNEFILENEKNLFDEMIGYDNLWKATRSGKAQFFNFCFNFGEQNIYYQIKALRDETNPLIDGLIVGVHNVDIEVRRELEATARLEDIVHDRTKELADTNEKLEIINEDIVELLGNIVEARNLESGEHIKRVKKFTKILATKVMECYPEYGLNENSIRTISSASAMHDVGKVMIPDTVLLKPGKLTKEEFEIMKTHTTCGCEIIDNAPKDWSEEYRIACHDICRWHHEKYDGRGYPDGLIGDEIPISAQIVCVADCFDALTTKRCYKDAFEPEVAYKMILNGECGSMNPKVIECFKKSKKEFFELVEKK